MLQVDLLWVYAIGSMFSTSAGKQIKRMKGDGELSATPIGSIYFALLLLYLSAIFVPEAVWLLWNFPPWETMHVWKFLDEIPAALVTMFLAGDFMLAVLGYYVSSRLITASRDYVAHLQWLGGYFAFFFILLYGWDGTGWQRFTWDPTVTGSLWEPGKTMFLQFARSNVALTLYAMALPTILPLAISAYWMLKEGHTIDDMRDEASSLALKGVAVYFAGVGVSLILAIIAAAVSVYSTHLAGTFGFVFGIAITGVIAYLLAFREGRFFHRIVLRSFNLYR
ncbi:hypothetical protein [Archaeoglobus neptunius]|uniref:hypothetical protein n=1 Tax=Archaeoglobus neptunius TaxID=2798580 RepID=UPI001927FD1B|nr:hypothetical protein [Archaeoglobus neptunius]